LERVKESGDSETVTGGEGDAKAGRLPRRKAPNTKLQAPEKLQIPKRERMKKNLVEMASSWVEMGGVR
jgi:hypothetical protein